MQSHDLKETKFRACFLYALCMLAKTFFDQDKNLETLNVVLSLEIKKANRTSVNITTLNRKKNICSPSWIYIQLYREQKKWFKSPSFHEIKKIMSKTWAVAYNWVEVGQNHTNYILRHKFSCCFFLSKMKRLSRKSIDIQACFQFVICWCGCVFCEKQ